jgi:hypothetical protein
MAIDFTGKSKEQLPEEENTQPTYVDFYIPKEGVQEDNRKKLERLAKKEKETQVTQGREDAQRDYELDDAINLSSGYEKRKRRVRIVLALVVVFLLSIAVTLLGYYVREYFARNAPASSGNSQSTQVQEVPATQEEVTQEGMVIPQGGVLPDTPLAPLDGALVTFRNDATIYLVERNGELRVVDEASVIFDNGQTLSEVSQSRIYLLPDTWASIRKGVQEVRGQVDFDPRVLTLPELRPFL